MSRRKNKKSPVAVLCSTLGTIILISLILVCLPLTVPKFFGYHMYTVVSGSMEPAIPTGSLVYIKEGAPEAVQKGDVIAFYGVMDQNAIITHRVVENNSLMGEFITKGDANQTEDMNPVPYSHYIGYVESYIPTVGAIAQIATGVYGKVIAGGMIGLAVILEGIASLVNRRRSKKES